GRISWLAFRYLRECPLQRVAAPCHGNIGGLEHPAEENESVHHVLELDVLGGAALGDEPVRERAPFVTQRVESGGQHERFRQARQTACKQRRCPPVLPV